ncbi:MAG: sigma-70 family RNA polymerase sigma factor [Deltaproteobacteria bacterium]|nr:sigma-70 family RNA polymerase sigma factor [Deltaproteobacteria bacterium]MBW2446191.1 sigma-70 family RNA polymerase sigma factor [Deltaproteobacteria bacterium]
MAEPKRSRQEWDAEDEVLVREIAQGDTDAFRKIFKRYYPRVYAFVLRRLGESTAAEDTTVETFAELWRTAKKFRGESRPSTWIYGIAHFKSLAARRAAGRNKRSKVISVDFETLSRAPSEEDPVERLEAREEVRRVRQAIEALPQRYRQVIELAFFENLPYSEIARRLGMAEGTVKTQISRARERLRRQLAMLQAGEETDPDDGPSGNRKNGPSRGRGARMH